MTFRSIIPEDGDLDPEALRQLAAEERIRMIEIKFSQGAKPGKGGLLPKEKITREISELRKVSTGKDVVSPPFLRECVDLSSTVAFIDRIQQLVPLTAVRRFLHGTTPIPAGNRKRIPRTGNLESFTNPFFSGINRQTILSLSKNYEPEQKGSIYENENKSTPPPPSIDGGGPDPRGADGVGGAI